MPALRAIFCSRSVRTSQRRLRRLRPAALREGSRTSRTPPSGCPLSPPFVVDRLFARRRVDRPVNRSRISSYTVDYFYEGVEDGIFTRPPRRDDCLGKGHVRALCEYVSRNHSLGGVQKVTQATSRSFRKAVFSKASGRFGGSGAPDGGGAHTSDTCQ